MHPKVGCTKHKLISVFYFPSAVDTKFLCRRRLANECSILRPEIADPPFSVCVTPQFCVLTRDKGFLRDTREIDFWWLRGAVLFPHDSGPANDSSFRLTIPESGRTTPSLWSQTRL